MGVPVFMGLFFLGGKENCAGVPGMRHFQTKSSNTGAGGYFTPGRVASGPAEGSSPPRFIGVPNLDPVSIRCQQGAVECPTRTDCRRKQKASKNPQTAGDFRYYFIRGRGVHTLRSVTAPPRQLLTAQTTDSRRYPPTKENYTQHSFYCFFKLRRLTEVLGLARPQRTKICCWGT